MSSAQDKIGDNTKITAIEKGRILYSLIEPHEFNNLFISCIDRVIVANSIKCINQTNIRVPVLNSPNGIVQNAFNLKYINGTAFVNQTNNYTNQLLASSFLFNITIPNDIIPENYMEEYIIKIFIIREFRKTDPNYGPKLSEVLNLLNEDGSPINPSSYITCMKNINTRDNFQIMGTLTVHMGLGLNNFIVPYNIKYINNPDVIFDNTAFTNSGFPIIGNFYVFAIKKTIRSAIVPTRFISTMYNTSIKNPNNDDNDNEDINDNYEEDDKEIVDISKKLDNLNLDTSVPFITLTSRHLLQ
jgi:hypothetical protein